MNILCHKYILHLNILPRFENSALAQQMYCKGGQEHE